MYVKLGMVFPECKLGQMIAVCATQTSLVGKSTFNQLFIGHFHADTGKRSFVSRERVNRKSELGPSRGNKKNFGDSEDRSHFAVIYESSP